MYKASLLGLAVGLVVLAAPAGALAAQSGTDCNYASGSPAGTTVNGNQLYVYAGPGGSSGTASTAVGACVNVPAGAGVMQGGLVEVGSGTNNGGGTGVYGVIDGNNNNNGHLAGYGGISNYENSGSGGCTQFGDTRSTNSGGCVAIKPANLVLPIPFVICGDTSGKDWDATAGNGCMLPL